MKTPLVVSFILLASAGAARANFGYCFAPGLAGGTKVVIHDHVREADFWDGATVDVYRKLLETSHRFRFGSLSCPGFDTEAEAVDSLTRVTRVYLEHGFVDFPYPPRPAAD